MINQIIDEMFLLVDERSIDFNKRILQIIPNGYGENDKLIGVCVPNLRKIAKKYYKVISLNDVLYFLNSDIHEYKVLAVIFFTMMYKNMSDEVFNLYTKNLIKLDNWDLIDMSCYKIIGNYLYDNYSKNDALCYLKKLYDSSNFWQRRIAIVSIYYFIKNNDLEMALQFLSYTIMDSHHLNNKALGWMLREVGKRNKNLLIDFINNNYLKPITFNYATEKFDQNLKICLKQQQKDF